jgi:hypothetical protein
VFWRGSIWTAGREEDAELTQTAADDWRISRRSGTVVPPPHADELAIGHCRIEALRADGAIEAKRLRLRVRASTRATNERLRTFPPASRSTLPRRPAYEVLQCRQFLEVRNHEPPDESAFHGLR